jgi:pimeloyl-ACP methyl ester carboxylesterase
MPTVHGHGQEGGRHELGDIEGRHANRLRPDRSRRGFGRFRWRRVDRPDYRQGRSGRARAARPVARYFTVFNYDRRGRAESGDTQPYALQREIEDLDAVIAEAGDGPVYVYGASSGGCLALQAVAAGLPVSKLAVYDLPYVIDEEAVHDYSSTFRTST